MQHIGINTICEELLDETFLFCGNTEPVGRGAMSCGADDRVIYLEWIEFFDKYKGKHLLGDALRTLNTKYNAHRMEFTAIEELVPMYKHIGAIMDRYR